MDFGIEWNKSGTKHFEAGIDRGVLYPSSGPGVAWSGLISVDHSVTGGTIATDYIDGVPYFNDYQNTNFGGSIKAFTYPDEFELSDGSYSDGSGMTLEMQDRLPFSLSYRTRLGNDTRGIANNYRIHLVYNATVAPSSISNTTQQQVTTPVNFSWNFTTLPLLIPGRLPTGKISFDRNKSDPEKFEWLEHVLYGTRFAKPKLPSIEELLVIFHPDYKFPGLGG